MNAPEVVQFFREEDGRLTIRSLLSGGTTYDVEWSRRHGCYIFHASGGTDTTVWGPYWARNVATREEPTNLMDEASRARNATERLRELPFELEHDSVLEHLEHNGVESRMVWCDTCEDWSGEELEPCDHLVTCAGCDSLYQPSDRHCPACGEAP